ncbi:hypothetical protein BBJ28_00023756 [Nothophytophthora sp. Chile5]|nr:hypothetical protein BBJ28_00023756 [Nothophytophthora sp. Chile5]
MPVDGDESDDDELVSHSFRVRDSSLDTARHHVLNGSTKFRKALETATRIADIMSRNGTPTFMEMMKSLKIFEDVAKDGEAPFVSRSWADPLSQIPLSQLVVAPDTESATAIETASSSPGEYRPDDDMGSAEDDVPATAIASDTENDVRIDGVDDHIDAVTPSTSHNVIVSAGMSHPVVVSSNTSHSVEVTIEPSHLVEVPAEAIYRGVMHEATSTGKRRSPDDDGFEPSASSSSSEDRSFFVSKSAKSRGQPRVRRNQKREDKKQRMVVSRKEAKQLVQGTLAPVTDLKAIAKILAAPFSYDSANEILSSIPIKTVGARKQAFARLVSPEECVKAVKYVLPKHFVAKCMAAMKSFKAALSITPESDDSMGVRVPKLGILCHADIDTMMKWHQGTKTLETVCDTAAWAEASSFNRLDIPTGFDEFKECPTVARGAAIRQLLVNTTRHSPFGEISNLSLLLLRGHEWLDDDCLMHIMTTLQELHPFTGIITPMYSRISDEANKYKVIATTKPFNAANKHVLLPIHLKDSHWCGAVFSFKEEPKTLTIFDPQQDDAQIEYCKETIGDMFGEMAKSMKVVRQEGMQQRDGVNCGVYVLLFFECVIRGIPFPTSLSQSALRYYRLRYLLQSRRQMSPKLQ